MRDAELIFADHMGHFYARRYGFAPMAGRLLGYLAICDPMQQSIADLADALLASRSAVVGAVNMLERMNLVRRMRIAGERADWIVIDTSGMSNKGFDPTEYIELAALAREGLALLENAPPARRAVLEEVAALADFLAGRMPSLLQEWKDYRDALDIPSSSEQER